jgi:hypothetical protein
MGKIIVRSEKGKYGSGQETVLNATQNNAA